MTACTRALDRPDVPLVNSSTKFLINIILDFLVISKFHVESFEPTVNMQATTPLACGIAASLVGLGHLTTVILCNHKESLNRGDEVEPITPSLKGPSLKGLKTLARCIRGSCVGRMEECSWAYHS